MTAKGHLIFQGISRGKWGLKKEGKLFIYNTISISIYVIRYSCQYTAEIVVITFVEAYIDLICKFIHNPLTNKN